MNDNKKPLCTQCLFAVCFLVPTIITRVHAECSKSARRRPQRPAILVKAFNGTSEVHFTACVHPKGKSLKAFKEQSWNVISLPILFLARMSRLVGNGDCLERSGRWHGVFRASSLKQGQYLISCEVCSLFVLKGSHVISDGNPLFQSVSRSV